jgi:hypothetical protein
MEVTSAAAVLWPVPLPDPTPAPDPAPSAAAGSRARATTRSASKAEGGMELRQARRPPARHASMATIDELEGGREPAQRGWRGTRSVPGGEGGLRRAAGREGGRGDRGCRWWLRRVSVGRGEERVGEGAA